jgi:hypothetical protein
MKKSKLKKLYEHYEENSRRLEEELSHWQGIATEGLERNTKFIEKEFQLKADYESVFEEKEGFFKNEEILLRKRTNKAEAKVVLFGALANVQTRLISEAELFEFSEEECREFDLLFHFVKACILEKDLQNYWA